MRFLRNVWRFLFHKMNYVVNQIFNRQNRCNLLLRLGVRFAQARIGQINMWVDLRNGLGQYYYIHQQYESFETCLIEQVARPGTTVVDIGANVGYYTLVLAKQIGPAGKVIAIEPDPSNMSLLRRNLQLNHLDNVLCEQAAALDHEGETTLYLSDINDGDHRVFDAQDDARFNQGKKRMKVVVRAIVVDKYMAELGKQADLVKVDIQGAEMLALPGMLNTLSHPDVVLFCEFWPYALRQAGSDPIQFLETLKNQGFELFEILEATHKVTSVNVNELVNRFSDPEYANLICVRRPRSQSIPFLAALAR